MWQLILTKWNLLRNGLSFFCLFLMLLVNPAHSLVILTWEHYINEDLVVQWQKENQQTIQFIYYDSDEKIASILSEADERGIDLVVISSNLLNSQEYGEIMMSLSQATTDEIGQFDDFYLKECGNNGIPYFSGALGMVYRKSVFGDNKPNSWDMLIRPPAELKQRIGMMIDHKDSFTGPLRLLGYSISSTQQEALKASYELLQKQMPSVLTYEYVISYLDEGQNTEQLALALAYSGDELALNKIEQTQDWQFSLPHEGTSLWQDCFSVLASSQKKSEAVEFLKFLNEPSNAVINTIDMGLPTANVLAAQKLSESHQNEFNQIFPDVKHIKQSEFHEELGERDMKQRRQILRAIIKQHEFK